MFQRNILSPPSGPKWLCWKVERIIYSYRWHQHFWPLKCMNWNLRANHLLEVRWKQRKWGKRNCLLPSFSGLCHQNQQPKMVEATIQKGKAEGGSGPIRDEE
jgi:hypothetical protein